tara:strand:+ start:667 stop:996 length:330 start_codon:yes stop_codon:yes gene_type:complete
MPRDRNTNERSSEPRSISDVLKYLVNDFGHGGLLYLLHQHWEAAVGITVAEHCKPQKIVGEELFINVDHPGWATEIQYLERELLGKLTEIDSKLQFSRIKVHVKGIQDS